MSQATDMAAAQQRAYIAHLEAVVEAARLCLVHINSVDKGTVLEQAIKALDAFCEETCE